RSPPCYSGNSGLTASSRRRMMVCREKELCVQYEGHPIRAFCAFDPVSRTIVLCAGDKSNDKRFYGQLSSGNTQKPSDSRPG
ncbi:type II toxin-antitoxin system RelE/ParE family toxin, partial [Salmonella enterica]|nr:type II toxin-antitoxin system RelE/ParE family toxin [Salmonella enterica]